MKSQEEDFPPNWNVQRPWDIRTDAKSLPRQLREHLVGCGQKETQIAGNLPLSQCSELVVETLDGGWTRLKMEVVKQPHRLYNKHTIIIIMTIIIFIIIIFIDVYVNIIIVHKQKYLRII